MPLASLVAYIAAAGASAALAWSAVTDIRFRRIPNLAVIAVIVCFAVWIAARGGYGIVSSLGAFGIALAVTVLMYLFKVIGAGDSKMFSATALFMGLGFLPAFALATVLTGGVIAAVSLVTRPQRALVMFTLRGKGDYGRGIPYGVAIAVGGILVLWGSMLGYIPPIGQSGPSLYDMRTTFGR